MHDSKSNSPKLRITSDGSHTLYSPQFNQHYHNPNGAIAESKHNFFETNGLYQALEEREQINILEVGFGTGLNLLLLMDALNDIASPPSVIYHSIEAWPISAEMASSFNFDDHLNHPTIADELPPIFDALTKGINTFEPTPSIIASIFYGFFDAYNPDDLLFDFIFHDAFSPAVNPELWSGDVFKKLLQWSTPDAILSTYSAASKAKGAMAWAGWKVAKAPGALGKREMTLASPNPGTLTKYKSINTKRLVQRYEQGDF